MEEILSKVKEVYGLELGNTLNSLIEFFKIKLQKIISLLTSNPGKNVNIIIILKIN